MYHSSTGNTKKIAKAIADEISCPLEELCKTSIIRGDELDLLFIGDGIYYCHPDISTIMFINGLDASKVKNVALFCTCGDVSSAGESLKRHILKQGLNLIGEPFVCKGEAWGLINKNHPDKKDIENVREFARTIIQVCAADK